MPKQRDLTGLVKAVGTVIREQLAKTLRPIVERLEGLEQRLAAGEVASCRVAMRLPRHSFAKQWLMHR
jgi:hypothetical protein